MRTPIPAFTPVPQHDPTGKTQDQFGFIHRGGSCPVDDWTYLEALTRDGKAIKGYATHMWWGRHTDFPEGKRPKANYIPRNEIVRYNILRKPLRRIPQPNQFRKVNTGGFITVYANDP